MEKEKVIEKIRKIMALAEKNPSQNEAISAALKAQKLMAQYHISESDILEEITEEKVESMVVPVDGKTEKWRFSLAVVLAKNFRCKCYACGADVAFFGMEEDIKICSQVFNSLYKIGKKLSDKEKRDIREKYGTAKGVKNNFCIGFVKGVQTELEKQCTALMIIIPKKVEEEFEVQIKGKPRKISTKTSYNRDIWERGFRAGQDAVQAKRIQGSF